MQEMGDFIMDAGNGGFFNGCGEWGIL